MFPPKGKRPGDQHQVIRQPSETRPLKCKNHDNKIIAAERNFAIAPFIKKHACELQIGFITGRNFFM